MQTMWNNGSDARYHGNYGAKFSQIDNNTTIIIAASKLVHWLGVQVQQYVEGK